MKNTLRDIFFGIALAMIFAGLWLLFELPFALLVMGVLLLVLLIKGVMFPEERRR